MAVFDNIEYRLIAKDEASKVAHEVAAAIKDLSKEMADSQKVNVKSGASWLDFAKGMIGAQVAIKAATMLFSAFTSVAGGAIKEAGRVESLTAGFEVMAGSAEKGRLALRQLQQVALDNPVLGLEQIQTGGQRLLAMGSAADQVAPQMKMLGDIAGGLGADKLPQLVTAFGQVQTKGKLMGQEIMQFAEAGVPIIDALAQKFGKTKGEILDMSSKGQISFGEMQSAMNDLAKNKFGELAAKQAETLSGKVAKLQDAWQIFLQNQGSKILEWAKKFIDLAIYIVNDVLPKFASQITAIADNPKFKAFLDGVFIAIKDYVIPAIVWLIGILKEFGTAAFQILSGFADIFGATSGDVKKWVTILGEVLKILIRSLGVAALGILTGLKALVGGFLAFGSSMASTAGAIWNGLIGIIQSGLNFLTKNINKALEAYDTVSKALGGKGTETRVSVDLSSFKIDTGTLDALNKNATDVLSRTTESFKKDLGTITNFASGTFGKVTTEATGAATAAVGGLKDIGAGVGDAVGKGADKVKGAVKGVQEDYAKAVAKASESLTQLENKHAETTAKISDKIAELKGKLEELAAEYSKTMKGFNTSEADKVVEQEEKVKKLKNDLAMEQQDISGKQVESTQKLLDLEKDLAVLRQRQNEQGPTTNDSAKQSLLNQISDNLEAQKKARADAAGGVGGVGGTGRYDEIKEELDKETAALTEYYSKRTGLEAEITEARRRASLTDFQRFIEDLNAKRAETDADYLKKKTQVEDDIRQQETNLERERVVFLAKKELYIGLQTQFQTFHDSYKKNLENMNAATQKNVDDMKKKLEQLQTILAAIESAKADAGIAGVVGVEGASGTSTPSAPSSPVAGGNVTINLGGVSLSNEADERRLAQTIADTVRRQLQLVPLGSQ